MPLLHQMLPKCSSCLAAYQKSTSYQLSDLVFGRNLESCQHLYEWTQTSVHTAGIFRGMRTHAALARVQSTWGQGSDGQVVGKVCDRSHKIRTEGGCPHLGETRGYIQRRRHLKSKATSCDVWKSIIVKEIGITEAQRHERIELQASVKGQGSRVNCRMQRREAGRQERPDQDWTWTVFNIAVYIAIVSVPKCSRKALWWT